MRSDGIRRQFRFGLALGVLATLTLVPTPASASGGGGCGGPVTDEAGTAVEIRGFCFSPTILRVGAGQEVSFRNTDPTTHNVLGANATWGGYDSLRRGAEVAYRFEESGVYPYVCVFHPGMVGAVVVGDGSGGEIDTLTAAGPILRVVPPAPLAQDPLTIGSSSGTTLGGAVGGAIARATWWPGFPTMFLAVSVAGIGLLGAEGAAIRRWRRRKLA